MSAEGRDTTAADLATKLHHLMRRITLTAEGVLNPKARDWLHARVRQSAVDADPVDFITPDEFQRRIKELKH